MQILLKPTFFFNNIKDIDLNILKELNIKVAFVDIDCTLASQDSKILFTWAKPWLLNVLNSGIKIILLSNNFKKRVSEFAGQLSLPYISFAMKPIPLKLLLNNNKFLDRNIKKDECVIIGDQIFTDILCANLCGMKSILLNPTSQSKRKFMVIRNILEKKIKKNLKMNTNNNNYI